MKNSRIISAIMNKIVGYYAVLALSGMAFYEVIHILYKNPHVDLAVSLCVIASCWLYLLIAILRDRYGSLRGAIHGLFISTMSMILPKGKVLGILLKDLCRTRTPESWARLNAFVDKHQVKVQLAFDDLVYDEEIDYEYYEAVYSLDGYKYEISENELTGLFVLKPYHIFKFKRPEGGSKKLFKLETEDNKYLSYRSSYFLQN